MPKELLLTMIHHKLYIELAVTEIIYVTAWLILFRLGFKFIRAKAWLRGALPAALVMALYSLIARQYFSIFVYHLLALPLAALLLFWLTEGFHIIKVSWAGLLAVIGQITGVVIISTICILDKNSAVFFFKTFWGNIAGIGIGLICPIIALLILPKYDNADLIPFSGKKKDFKSDFLMLLALVLIYVGLCGKLDMLFIDQIYCPKFIYDDLRFIWIIMSIFVLMYIYFLHDTRELSASYALNEHTLLFYEMQALRRLLLEENKQLNTGDQELPKVNNIFEAEDIRPEVTAVIVEHIIRKLQEIINNPSLIDLTLFEQFTNDELSVIILISHGDNNKKIANILNLTEKQVENIINKLLNKFGVNDQFYLGAYIIYLNYLAKTKCYCVR